MRKNKNDITPPHFAEKLLLWFLKKELAEEVLGDLDEKFYATLNKNNISKAKRNYWYQVFNYMRPFAFKFLKSKLFKNTTMINHNFKVSFRQMLKHKGYSFINIVGLAAGMVVAILIGLWVNDELSFNKYHDNHRQIVQILRQVNDGNERLTNEFLTTGMGTLLRENLSNHFEHISMFRSRNQTIVLGVEDDKFTFTGHFAEENTPLLLGLKMKYGQQDGMTDNRTVMLSKTAAQSLFGDQNPIGETVKLNASIDLQVVGVFEDIPMNSTFEDTDFLIPLITLFGGNQDLMNRWNNYNIHIYASIKPESNIADLTPLVNETLLPRLGDKAKELDYHFLLHPMSEWHSTEFINGEKVTSQSYKFIWLYGLIGAFVLLLACINFMNLSTARSEKRAKEIGIRKTLGSLRKQLSAQFYIESFLYTFSAFALSLILLALLLPWFNDVSAKMIGGPWSNYEFWTICIGFILFTTLVSGSYPAAYLSNFRTIKALKGGLKFGKSASIPRKVLVVFQFTISVALIIGTITVNNQIQTAKSRPIGYSPKGMISLRPATPNLGEKKELLSQEIVRSGMATAVGFSNYPVISNLGWNGGFTWEGMDPAFDQSFNTISISNGYAEAVGMDFIDGRGFDKSRETDKNAIIINRSAMESMQLEDPVGTVVRYAPGFFEPRNYTIIGVVEDMIKGSPFEQTDQSIMFLDQEFTGFMYIRLNPGVSANESVAKIGEIFKEILPEAPFNYQFADDDYNRKFEAELRIGYLARFFTGLAILISCLGLFGLSSFIAEQRTKEIGIRKVLGASVSNLWKLLSKDFALLIMLSCIIAIPVSYNVLQGWLDGYEVRTQLYWWIFALAGIGGMFVTLLTVSFQSVKAAIANPVKSLRSE